MIKRFSYKPTIAYTINPDDLNVPDKNVHASMSADGVIRVMQVDKWQAFVKKERWDDPDAMVCLLEIQLNDKVVDSIRLGDCGVQPHYFFSIYNTIDPNNSLSKLLSEYNHALFVEQSKWVKNLATQYPIEYEPCSDTEPKSYHVRQGQAVMTQGPVDDINCLGTRGLGPCVAVAVVTHIEGEEFPRVSLAHFDSQRLEEKGLNGLLYDGGFGKGNTHVYLISGETSNSTLIKISDLLSEKNIPIAVDVSDGMAREVAIDLKTGKPVALNSTPVRWVAENVDGGIERGNLMRQPLVFRGRLNDIDLTRLGPSPLPREVAPPKTVIPRIVNGKIVFE